MCEQGNTTAAEEQDSVEADDMHDVEVIEDDERDFDVHAQGEGFDLKGKFRVENMTELREVICVRMCICVCEHVYTCTERKVSDGE
jgi:hypothetical protein